MVGSRPANASTDSRVDELFTALRDQQFTKATEHFDPVMKAGLSADQLSAVWLQIVASVGKLENWKTIGRGQLAGTDVFTVAMAFEHGKLLATVSVRPQTEEIAGLYFKPMAPEVAGKGLDVPILILRGSRDYQVLDEDISTWQNGLKGIAKVKVDTLPTLNHLFIAGAGKPGPDEYNTPGHVDVGVIEAIASFINGASAPQTAAN